MHIVALIFVVVVSWTLAVYFRIAPDGAPLIRPGRAAASSAVPISAGPGPAASPTPTAASTITASTAAPVASTSVPVASASASVDASAAPTASAAATSTPAVAQGDVTACVVGLFPDGTFVREKPDFAFVCENTDPRRGITEVQAAIVSGRQYRAGVTPGMRLWSYLGWYQVAAYALLRGHCCQSAPELVWSMELPCPFDEAVAKVETAIRTQDAKMLEGALGYYATTARCLAKAGLGGAFNQRAYPGPGQAAFRKMIALTRQTARR